MNDGSLPRREAIVDLLNKETRALHAREIAARMHLADAAYPSLLRVLSDLVNTGVITPQSGQRFRTRTRAAPPSREVERTGVLTMHPRGFGFVASVGFDDDLYIPDDKLAGAMHGDIVEARRVARSSRGSEGEVLRVVERSHAKVAGVLRRRGSSMWIEPDDVRVRGPIVLTGKDDARIAAGAEEGSAAVAKITRYPEFARENVEGELEVVLGSPGDPKVEVAKILVRESIEDHPEDAVREAEAYGLEVAREALAGREDLTHLPLPTIDPEDARDHDDAVWCIRKADGTYQAWIAIADVSHYVKPGTALDKAALARGCSIYLPDRAIPMLPRALSSNLCSLLPNVIRLCLCVEAELDATGTVTSSRVVEGFMRSQAKLTYGGVARALGFTDKPARSPEAEAMVDSLRVLGELSGLLRAQRMRRGALDFELPEVKIVLDQASGAPVGVERRSEDPGVKKAYSLIEELMLLANELVARWLTEREVPAIFRVHAPPDEAKLDRFANMATTLGVQFEMDDAKDPKRLSALLKRVSRHPARDVFNMLLLRAMKQATYDTANIGHFGLASSSYLHFTSPIRRYPDMVVHRAVRALLRKTGIDKSDSALETLKTSAVTASERERHAMDIEREVVDLYRALYMRGHIGETFAGKVTALVGSGAFVQLDSPFVDVLVKTEALGRDRYELDDNALKIVGQRSGDTINLGDRMEVVIDDVALLRRSVYGRRVGAPLGEPVRSGQHDAFARPGRHPRRAREMNEPIRYVESDAPAEAERPSAPELVPTSGAEAPVPDEAIEVHAPRRAGKRPNPRERAKRPPAKAPKVAARAERVHPPVERPERAERGRRPDRVGTEPTRAERRGAPKRADHGEPKRADAKRSEQLRPDAKRGNERRSDAKRSDAKGGKPKRKEVAVAKSRTGAPRAKKAVSKTNKGRPMLKSSLTPAPKRPKPKLKPKQRR